MSVISLLENYCLHYLMLIQLTVCNLAKNGTKCKLVVGSIGLFLKALC